MIDASPARASPSPTGSRPGGSTASYREVVLTLGRSAEAIASRDLACQADFGAAHADLRTPFGDDPR